MYNQGVIKFNIVSVRKIKARAELKGSRERLKTLLLWVFCIHGAARSELIVWQMGFIGKGVEVFGNKSQIRVYFTVKTNLISGKQYGNRLKE